MCKQSVVLNRCLSFRCWCAFYVLKLRALSGGCCSCLLFGAVFSTILLQNFYRLLSLSFCFVRWCRQYLERSYFMRNLGWAHCFFLLLAFPFSTVCTCTGNCGFFNAKLSDLCLPLSDCFHSANRSYLPVASDELSRVSWNRLLYQ